MSDLRLNRSLTTYKPTHYLLDYGDFTMLLMLLCFYYEIAIVTQNFSWTFCWFNLFLIVGFDAQALCLAVRLHFKI